jgi:hypothetical protein
MSWEEVRGGAPRHIERAPDHTSRRRFAVAAAALAISAGTFAWFTTAFPDRTPDAIPRASATDTYVFDGVRVGPGTRDPNATAVSFGQAWSGTEYPGEHDCVFSVTDAAGAELARESVIMASHTPDGLGRNSVEFPDPIDGEPAGATITCSPDRLDTPVAFDIVDVRLERTRDGVLMTYTAAAPTGVVEPSYPGTNACTAWLELPGSWRFEHDFTLTAPPGTETDAGFDEEQVRRALDDGLLDQLSGGVDCHPYSAADVEP